MVPYRAGFLPAVLDGTDWKLSMDQLRLGFPPRDASSPVARLVLGSAVFGVGWGLSGYCPGPALASLVAGSLPLVAFVGAMLVGLLATRALVKPA